MIQYAGPCATGVTSCSNGVCTCAAGYTGDDCCQCAPGYYRSTDGTCKRMFLLRVSTLESAITFYS